MSRVIGGPGHLGWSDRVAFLPGAGNRPVLVRPDGYAAWAGEPNRRDIQRALRTWCGEPTSHTSA